MGDSAQQCLQHEKRCHHKKEPGAGALRGREEHLPRGLEGQHPLLAAMPAQEVPAPEDGEEGADAPENTMRDSTLHTMVSAVG